MFNQNFNLHDGKSGAAITVHITPRSKRNEIHGILDDGTVKIRLAVPQNGEKANQALVAFLAEVLEVDPAQLEIVAGEGNLDKLITIVDLDKTAVDERIMRQLG